MAEMIATETTAVSGSSCYYSSVETVPDLILATAADLDADANLMILLSSAKKGGAADMRHLLFLTINYFFFFISSAFCSVPHSFDTFFFFKHSSSIS